MKANNNATYVDNKFFVVLYMISNINKQRQTVTIMVEMFGRETPVEIAFYQIKKVD